MSYHRKEPDPKLLEQYPHLVPWPVKPKLSNGALAAANLRIELKRAFPVVKFSVKTELSSMSSSVTAAAQLFQADGHTQASVQEMNERARQFGHQFKYGTFDGMTDSFNYHNDPHLKAFQDAFGSVRHVFVEIRLAPEHVEAEEMAKRAQARKKKLEKTLPKGWETRGMGGGQKL